MGRVGRDVAQKVFDASRSIAYHDWVPLQAKQKEVVLKVRKPDTNMVERAKTILARPDSVKPAHWLEKTYEMCIRDSPRYEHPLEWHRESPDCLFG